MTPEKEAAWKTIEEAAKKEGTVVYYSLGSVPQNKVELLQSLWKQDYPDIKLEYLYVGNGSVMASRVTTEQEAKTYVADVVDVAVRQVRIMNPSFWVPFVPPAAEDPSVKWLISPIGETTPPRLTTANFAQYFAIWTNSNLVKGADVPKNIMDVVSNPKWKDQIISRQPWASGGGNHLYHFATQEYGREYVTKLQAQNPTFAEDQDQALIQVARGEFAIGLGLTGRTAGQLIKDGQPIAAVWPNDFVITVTEGMPIVTGAPHMNAAKVFVNWMLTEKGQQLWRDLGQFPVRADIPPAEPWMRGVENAKKTFENFLNAEQQEASYKQATADFKK